MLKKIIAGMLLVMSIVTLAGCTSETTVASLSPVGVETIIHETIEIGGVKLNEREMRIYEIFGTEIAGQTARIRNDCELRGDIIINEYVSIRDDYYEAVVRVEDKAGDKYEYFMKIPKEFA